MKNFPRAVLMLASCLLPTSLSAEAPRRLITLGGSVSETVCALDACDRIVAVDSSSLFPPRLSRLPQVGYARSLNAEGLLAQKADLVLATDHAGPLSVLDKVKAMGVTVENVDGGTTIEAAKNRIRALGDILGKKTEAATLITSLEGELERLKARRLRIQEPKKVLFLYARGGKVLQVAGGDTAAATMLELAGARNAVSGFTAYRQLTPEAAVAAAPQVILMTRDGLASLGGPDGVWQLPGLKMTPAFSHRKIVIMDDDFLLGMGPRLGQAAARLMDELYPEGKGP